MKHLDLECDREVLYLYYRDLAAYAVATTDSMRLLVNYAPPKGGEFVMLPMLPWQAYSTNGRLTDALPSRFSEYRLAAS